MAYIRKGLGDYFAERKGCISKTLKLVVEFPDSAYPVDFFFVLMNIIERGIIFIGKEGNNTAADSNAHSEHIDDNK